MRKIPALLFFAVLVLPYARAPLCQLGSHEHEEESHVVMAAMQEEATGHEHGHGEHHASLVSTPAEPGDGASLAPIGDADCHDLMRCQVGATVVAMSDGADSTIRLEIQTDERPAVRSLLGQQPAPELPPPRLI